MSTLKERLDRIRAGFKEQAPPEVLALMESARQGLADSGIMGRIPAAGGTLPGFALPDTDGNVVDSAGLLARGPLVVAFYRGVW